MEDLTKLCPRCETTKPQTEFYISAKGRLSAYCKPCMAAYKRANYKPRPARHETECIHCGGPIDLTTRSSRGRRFCGAECRVSYFNSLQTRDFRRDNHLVKRYGISLVEYNQRLAEQDGKCLLCSTPEEDARSGVLDVDHDHDTGAKRGLLCHRCNWGMGILGDDPVLLRKAADYLEGKL